MSITNYIEYKPWVIDLTNKFKQARRVEEIGAEFGQERAAYGH